MSSDYIKHKIYEAATCTSKLITVSFNSLEDFYDSEGKRQKISDANDNDGGGGEGNIKYFGNYVTILTCYTHKH